MQNTEKPRVKDDSTYCPLWRRPLSKVCHTCEWFVQLRGKDPQSDEMIDKWGCAMRWMPILQIEGTQQSRQAGASADKVATEVANLHEDINKAANIQSRAVHALARAIQEEVRQPDRLEWRDITPPKSEK